MYRQIQLHTSDRKYQHILWRFDPSEAIQEYELCSLTYGLNSAPFLAQRTIIQLVKDEGELYPLASKALQDDIYIDDVVTGAKSVDEAKKLQEELVHLLAKGCFTLSKWASNSQDLLQDLKEEDCQLTCVSLSSEDEPKIKLLGMQWMPNQDAFTYEVHIPSPHPSKRAILSAIARIYDPLGFLSPVVFYAKLILQDMWIAQCDWDDIGPSEIALKWHKFVSELHALSSIHISRCIAHEESSYSKLVGFCDASQRGYSATLYLVTWCNGHSYVHLIKAKTKLAPIKPMTIPRLELSGALLLSLLFKSCERLMIELSIQDVKFFTDSEIVLGWLATPPQKLNTFVAHRVIRILELTKVSSWAHVKSEDNPADCSSRGIPPGELAGHPLWWTGPYWLEKAEEEWPNAAVLRDNLPEMKKAAVTALTTQEDKPLLVHWIERFSSYQRLLNSLSYVLRFLRKLKHESVPTGPITLPELREAAVICARISQEHHPIDKKHLRTLHPVRGEDGLLRVGGRLENSSMHYEAKRPIILSSKAILLD